MIRKAKSLLLMKSYVRNYNPIFSLSSSQFSYVTIMKFCSITVTPLYAINCFKCCKFSIYFVDNLYDGALLQCGNNRCNICHLIFNSCM